MHLTDDTAAPTMLRDILSKSETVGTKSIIHLSYSWTAQPLAMAAQRLAARFGRHRAGTPRRPAPPYQRQIRCHTSHERMLNTRSIGQSVPVRGHTVNGFSPPLSRILGNRESKTAPIACTRNDFGASGVSCLVITNSFRAPQDAPAPSESRGRRAAGPSFAAPARGLAGRLKG